ncbi:hypothetical protein HYU93_04365 [Candidatus Daviesbacteria bacterium]|nr:hypothetical protein [Candidatus Daviesbacteria bacterium]
MPKDLSVLSKGELITIIYQQAREIEVLKEQIIDVPPVAAEITGHMVFKRYCFSCRKRFYPGIDLSSQVLGKDRNCLQYL